MSEVLITPQQQDILHAALDLTEEAGKAWKRWEKASQWTTSDVEGGAVRLFPLVYTNLKTHAPETASLARLKGIHRRSWCANTLLFNQVRPAMKALHEAGITLLIFKGLSVAEQYYDTISERPMADVDVLVSQEDLMTAYEILDGLGWERDWSGNLKTLFQFRHSIGLTHPKGGAFDIHQSVLIDNLKAGQDAPLWQRAQKTTWKDVPLYFPSPEDELLILCIHGYIWNPNASIRWVADVVSLLRKTGSTLDWAYIQEQAQQRELVYRLRGALNFLASQWPELIPASVLQEFEQRSYQKFEAKEAALLYQPAATMLQKVRVTSLAFRRLAGPPSSPGWFLRWFRYQLICREAPSLWEMPGWIYKKLKQQREGPATFRG